MASLPDSLRPAVAALAKWHFWILAGLLPLVLLPALLIANGSLKTTIDSERSKTDQAFAAAEAVAVKQDHPNDNWVKEFDARTAAVRQDILGEWNRLWQSQQPLRTWPPELGDVFLGAIAEVEAGKRPDLLQRDRQRYQNVVPDLVRKLPARMGCEELMVAADSPEAGGVGRPPRPDFALPGREGLADPTAKTRETLIWSAEDQQRLFNAFNWKDAPSTTQVLLAQEELWVYGQFCDVVRRMNEGATGHFNASITDVLRLAVGYPAAEESPGGQGTGRVHTRRTADAAGGFPGGELPPVVEPGLEVPADGLGGVAQPKGRPPHPRFSLPGTTFTPDRFGGGVPPAGGEGVDPAAEQPVAASPDDLLREWIYVDLTGRPLNASELATAPDAQLVHLSPFVLRVVMDQRQIDRLLQEIVKQDPAAGGVPIDVRQIRINPPDEMAGTPTGGGFEFGGESPLAGGRGLVAEGTLGGDPRRPFDVVVELRGTVGLAVPPQPKVLENGAAAEDGTGGGA